MSNKAFQTKLIELAKACCTCMEGDMSDDKQAVKEFLEFIYKTHKYVEAGNVSYPMIERDKINPVFSKLEPYLWHRQNCNALEEFNTVGYKHIRINELAKCDCFHKIKEIIYEKEKALNPDPL